MLKLIWLLIKEKLDKGTICDVEQLSQEFMKQIDKVKPKKKSAKKPESILYKAWSYNFLVLIIFQVNFGF